MKTTILALALAAGTALPQVKSSLRGKDEEAHVCTHPPLAPVPRAGAIAFTLLPPRLAARLTPDEETHAPPLDRSPPAEGA